MTMPATDFNVPRGSFPTPIAPIGVGPLEGPLVQVAFNYKWCQVIVGSLSQLLLNTTWDVSTQAELTAIQENVFDLMAAFCVNPPPLGVIPGVGAEGDEDFMIRQDPDNPCLLQTSIDGVNWCTFADISKCVTPTQPGAGSPQPAPGACQDFHGTITPLSPWLLPVPVSTGDTVKISNLMGAWSPLSSLDVWYCPDGDIYFAGACASGTSTPGGSGFPMPTAPVFGTVAFDGTNYYDISGAASAPVTITIAAGVNKKNLTILCNRVLALESAGEVMFDAQVCNNGVAAWTAVLDFTTNTRGFTTHNDAGGTPQAVWTAGDGWQQNSLPDYGSGLFVRRLEIALSGIAPFTITAMQCLYDFHPGTTIDTTADQAFGCINGGVHKVFESSTWGDPSGDNILGGGAIAQTGINDLFFDFYCGEAASPTDPGGTCTLKQMTISGTGPNPFTGP